MVAMYGGTVGGHDMVVRSLSDTYIWSSGHLVSATPYTIQYHLTNTIPLYHHTNILP